LSAILDSMQPIWPFICCFNQSYNPTVASQRTCDRTSCARCYKGWR